MTTRTLPIYADRVAGLDGLRAEPLLRQGVTAWAFPMLRQAGMLLGLRVRDRSEAHFADAVREPDCDAGPASTTDRSSAESSEDACSPANESSPASDVEAGSRGRLLERIRTLYAMAQQTEASPHEAEIALRRRQS